MKPINSPKATEKARHSHRRYNSPPDARRVKIDFYPHSSWTIEVGNIWPAAYHQHNRAATYCGDQPARGFAPIELVIAAENKKQALRQVNYRIAMELPI